MKLYYAKGACSFSCDILFREAGLILDLEKVDLKAHTTETGAEYTQINPKGYVPALQLDSGEVLSEALVVLSYLADQAPASNLMPQTGLARYRALEWLSFVGTELHKTTGPFHNPNAAASDKEMATKRLLKRVGYMDTMLEGKDYLLGSMFTAPDAYAFAILRWFPGFEIDLSSMKNISAYIARIRARPHVQEAFAFEGL
jgi:glutathione S-transferase